MMVLLDAIVRGRDEILRLVEALLRCDAVTIISGSEAAAAGDLGLSYLLVVVATVLLGNLLAKLLALLLDLIDHLLILKMTCDRVLTIFEEFALSWRQALRPPSFTAFTAQILI